MIKILHNDFYFVLEPIFNAHSKTVEGYEILSRPCSGRIDSEIFFSTLPVDIIENLFLEQISFFIKQCFIDSSLKRNIFINIHHESLLKKDVYESIISFSKFISINLEIQHYSATNDELYLNIIPFFSGYPVKIWIDDVTSVTKYTPELLNSAGIKIDKTTFWECYNKKISLDALKKFSADSVIIEGVESEDHIRYIRKFDISLAQGYYWPQISFLNKC
ncbi:TPA: EAL domain-containing protein [Enterobacter roggenkampii]